MGPRIRQFRLPAVTGAATPWVDVSRAQSAYIGIDWTVASDPIKGELVVQFSSDVERIAGNPESSTALYVDVSSHLSTYGFLDWLDRFDGDPLVVHVPLPSALPGYVRVVWQTPSTDFDFPNETIRVQFVVR